MAYKGWSGGKSINWDAVDTEAPKPLDVGVYKVKVMKAEPKENSKGDPAASLQFKVFERHGDDEELNRKTFDNLTFTDDGAFKAKMLGEALDIDMPETSGFEDVSDFCERLEGEEVWAYLVHNTYQGKTNNKISRYIHEDQLEDFLATLEDGGEDDKPKRKSKSKKASAKSANGKSTNGVSAKGKKDSDDLNDDDEDEDEDEKPKRRGAKAAAADEDEEEERPRRRRQARA